MVGERIGCTVIPRPTCIYMYMYMVYLWLFVVDSPMECLHVHEVCTWSVCVWHAFT